jgi:hypothetical protein
VTVGLRHFYSSSHVGHLRVVTHESIIVFNQPRGTDRLGFLHEGDLISVVGYDWREDELQVLSRIGVGWVGPSAMSMSQRLSDE